MYRFTQRSLFLVVAMLLTMVLGQFAQAQHVRYDARSPQGQKMLKIYADAVAKMKKTPEGDPDSWTFQWYTHWVNGDTTKAKELTRIFPMAGPNKTLATSMWDTCQPHFGGIEEDFLPWHRAYVYYFEEIIRAVSKEKNFTLPYWNYTAPGPNHGVIPSEFTKKNDPLFKSLYVEARNKPTASNPSLPNVNAGEPIDKNAPGGLNLDALKECFYSPTGPGHDGFNRKLNGGLHGYVHVQVGAGKNMGSVPWAANDPIFWMHHCNIDRLWASWNKAGRTNPAGMGQFTFAQNKTGVIAKMADWMSPDTEKHGYCYDHYEPVPKCLTTRDIHLAAVLKQLKVGAMKTKEIKLGNAPTLVKIDALAVKDEVKPKPFSARVKALPPEKHLLLVLKNLRADAQPGVVYSLYLELPEGATGDKAKPHFIGHINFFDSVKHGDDGHMKMEAKGPEVTHSFDITELARRLHARNLLHDHVTVTIAPAGQPAEKANPAIGEITIIEH